MEIRERSARRPTSAFVHFLRDRADQRPATMSLRLFFSKMKAEWVQLEEKNPAETAHFKEMARAGKVQYENHIQLLAKLKGEVAELQAKIALKKIVQQGSYQAPANSGDGEQLVDSADGEWLPHLDEADQSSTHCARVPLRISGAGVALADATCSMAWQ